MTEANTQMTVDYDFSPEAETRQKTGLLADLRTAFTQHDEHGFLLVDPAVFLDTRQEERLPAAILNHQPAATPTQIKHHRFESRYSPWLIPLDMSRSEDAELLALSITQALREAEPTELMAGRGRMVCGWLFSASPVSAIAQHISMTAVQPVSFEQPVMLRFYDPAVNNAFWPLLDNWQRSRLLGPITDWYLTDGDGQLLHRDNTQSARVQYTFSLGLTAEKVEKMSWSGPMNRALRRYRQAHRNQLRRTELESLPIMLALLRRVTARYPFNAVKSLEACALHGLLYHPEIDLHPRIQSLLSGERGNSAGGYAARTAGLTAEAWSALVHDCCHLSPAIISLENQEIL
ncbi:MULTISPECIES: DUF4123 domain-containing protein [Photorhabdus]|uniref:DUF4123 domain-containing protein n=2 Tax=Photorhabdus asymbiotica TaxID=291112 RepID=C7BMN9_PHOAA|nr:DUF4123 domain-containing protein [Photorhabdus asymbiotica]RKS59775.1 uncharacterized protein DUF4123 [Photorhabdus asymbiotica]CAQ85918.1 conserved hypothetical Protein [Photorhabdus asymbiotica]